MKGNVIGQGGVPRQGDNTALSNSVVGTTLKLLAPAGVYDGIDDTVNLLNFESTLGVRRVATGQVVVGGTSGNQTVNLSFTPSKVFIFPSATVDQFSQTAFFTISSSSDIRRQNSNTISSISSIKMEVGTNGTSVSTGGSAGSIGTNQFIFNASTNQTYTYFAIQ